MRMAQGEVVWKIGIDSPSQNKSDPHKKRGISQLLDAVKEVDILVISLIFNVKSEAVFQPNCKGISGLFY